MVAKENLKASGENFGKGTQISANPIDIKPIETRIELESVVSARAKENLSDGGKGCQISDKVGGSQTY